MIFKGALLYISAKGSEANLLKAFLKPDSFQALLAEIVSFVDVLDSLISDFQLIAFYHYLIRMKASILIIKGQKNEAKKLFRQAKENALLYQDESFIKTIDQILRAIDIAEEEKIDKDPYMSYIKDIVSMQLKDEVEKSKDKNYSDTIKIGIEDIDPTNIMRHCENLKIKYISTDPLGEAFGGLPIGSKSLSCGIWDRCATERVNSPV